MTSSQDRSLPVVAIVGRPNVGKSALFNRIVGERKAIVEDEPGTTRDRVEAEVEWQDRWFRLIDTGGFEVDTESVYSSLIVAQIEEAVRIADLVLFCIDVRDGLTASDYDVAQVLRTSRRPYLLVGTKADNAEREDNTQAEVAPLGLGGAIPVSALHDIGVGSLLDAVLEAIPDAPAQVMTDRIRVAIVGRPNVGKSSLVNAIVGSQRVIVSDVAGTTRDAIDTEVDTAQGAFTLIDTAGIRRPGKREAGVEKHSVMRAEGAIERADVTVLVIDGTVGATAQDAHIASMALEAHTGLVLAVNKIDLWEDSEERQQWLRRQMTGRLRFLPWALVGLISAKEGAGIANLLETVTVAREARRRRIPTAELNAVLKKAFQDRTPPVIRHRRLKLFYATQAGIDPPSFILFVNEPALLHFGYRRYLERILRTTYDFEGTAIRLILRARAETES